MKDRLDHLQFAVGCGRIGWVVGASIGWMGGLKGFDRAGLGEPRGRLQLRDWDVEAHAVSSRDAVAGCSQG